MQLKYSILGSISFIWIVSYSCGNRVNVWKVISCSHGKVLLQYKNTGVYFDLIYFVVQVDFCTFNMCIWIYLVNESHLSFEATLFSFSSSYRSCCPCQCTDWTDEAYFHIMELKGVSAATQHLTGRCFFPCRLLEYFKSQGHDFMYQYV